MKSYSAAAASTYTCEKLGIHEMDAELLEELVSFGFADNRVGCKLVEIKGLACTYFIGFGPVNQLVPLRLRESEILT